MPRPEKVQAVADIKERISNARAVFLAEYAGLSVAQQQTLRRQLKANGAEFKVVKMTLARLAAAELEIDTLDDHLLGPTGLTIADGDAVAAAKVLKDFAKAHDVFKVKGGLLGLDYLSPERVSELAEIEPREVLLAKLAGLFAAPMSSVAGLVVAVQRDVVGLVQALVEKREAAGEVAEVAEAAAAVEPPADEASAEPADAEEAADAEPEAAAEDAATEAADETVTEAAGDAEPEAPADEASAESADAEEAADAEPEAVVADAPQAGAEAETVDDAGAGDPDPEEADAEQAAEVTTDEDPAEEAEEE